MMQPDSGLKETQELADVLQQYRRLDETINSTCSTFKVSYLVALVENLGRLHMEAERLKVHLQRRIDLMA